MANFKVLRPKFHLYLLLLFIGSATACLGEHEALLITPSDPLFLSTINAEFPGLSSTEYFTRLSPYMVVIRNDGDSVLKAYMVDWDALTKGGGNRTFAQHFVDRFFTDPEYHLSIQPTSVRLLTPLFNLSGTEYLDLVKNNLLTTLYPASSLPLAQEFTSLQVSIDGVVWTDGIFRGPNHHRSLEEYRCIRNADHDEAVAITRTTKDRVGRDAMMNVLEHDITIGSGQIGPHLLDADPLLAKGYLHERVKVATTMKQMLVAEGPDVLAKKASAVAFLFPSGQPTRMASLMSQ